MRVITMQGLQVLRRARDFLVENKVDAALGPVARHVEVLGGIIDRLGTHAVEQDAATRAFREGTSRARRLKRALRLEYMRPVSHMARALFPNDATARAALAMPDAKDYEGIIAAARAMAERAGEHKERFTRAGFGEDFAERLQKAAGELREGLDDRGSAFGRRAAATAGMIEESARGRDIVKLLDSMVGPQLVDFPDRQAQWRTLSRFVRKASSADAGPSPATGAVPPAPVAPQEIVRGNDSPGAVATPDEHLDRAA